MRARLADSEGFVEHDGVKIHYEVYGVAEPTILLMPTWTLIHKRFWKGQLPYLARHHRVVTYDGPGNGRSDRPLEPAAYRQEAQVAYAVKVLGATGTDRAVVVALSKAANWALDLAANHTSRVHGIVLIGPTVAVAAASTERTAHIDIDGPAPDVGASRVRLVAADPPEHWAKYNRDYWLRHYEDFLWFFLGQCFSEPYSTKHIEDGVGWGLETSGAVLVADSRSQWPDAETIGAWCRRISGPVLLIHGDDDRVSPVRRSEILKQLTGAELVTLAGGGHIPLARDPVQVNLLIREFAARFRASRPAPRTWARWNRRPKRVPYLSSPIGLGHARRDLAIATELRRRHPDVEIDWLAQHPVTRMLERAGERVHPASAWLAKESAHIESEAGEHDLHCFEALRRMDEVLLANFMVFHDVVHDARYDLVVGDEAWDVDHYLHENPELKRFGYAWFTDFVGYLPMPGGGLREELVTADYNAEMIEHIDRHPRLRDRAISATRTTSSTTGSAPACRRSGSGPRSTTPSPGTSPGSIRPVWPTARHCATSWATPRTSGSASRRLADPESASTCCGAWWTDSATRYDGYPGCAWSWSPARASTRNRFARRTGSTSGHTSRTCTATSPRAISRSSRVDLRPAWS